MAVNEIQPIVFVYESNEYKINAHPSISIERFLDQIKVHFHIPRDESMDFINIDTNVGIAPYRTSDFWYNIETDTPRYRIQTSESKKILIDIVVPSAQSIWLRFFASKEKTNKISHVRKIVLHLVIDQD